MSETPIGDLIERMLAANLPHASVVDAVRTIETLGLALPATLPITLPATRSRKAVNQQRYRNKLKQLRGETVALASDPAPVTNGNESGNGVTSVTTDLSSLPLVAKEGIQESEGDRTVVVEGARARRRGARLADDWTPSVADCEFAARRGLILAQIETEATKFRNYWTNRTDKQAAKLDWSKAWQNWILNVKPTSNGNGHGPESTRDRQRRESAEALEQLRRFAENGADDEGPGGTPRQSNAGLLPFAKPA